MVCFVFIHCAVCLAASIGWRRTLQQSSRKEQGMTRLSRFRQGVHVLGLTKGKLAVNYQNELLIMMPVDVECFVASVVGFQLMAARVNNLKQFLVAQSIL